MELLIGGIIWIVCVICAEIVAVGKGRSGCGFSLLALLLGPIGLVAAAIASPNERVLTKRELRSGRRVLCQWCDEPISPNASFCPHCHQEWPVNEERVAIERRKRWIGDMAWAIGVLIVLALVGPRLWTALTN